jgi:hypothetical protein
MLVITWTASVAVAACGSSSSQPSKFQDASVDAEDSAMGAPDSSQGGDHNLVNGDGGNDGGCIGKTCQELGYNCGPNSDGCGNTIQCGTCPSGESCGNGGFSKCGPTIIVGSDGGIVCTPTTCKALGYNCGYAGDGCGNLLDCNADDAGPSCPTPQFCGGGGFDQCGGNDGLLSDGGTPCTPTTCKALGYNCGYAGDGCGNLLDCNPNDGSSGCTLPQYCGGGGFNLCGGNIDEGPDGGSNCVPESCQKQGFNCGPAGDGCGNLQQCGTCVGNNTCGGGGKPGVCGNSTCTGLCLQQAVCSTPGVFTTIQGKVIAGTPSQYGSPDPVPNVLVYVPNAPLKPFTSGATCSQCGADVSGSPLVQTTTAFDGTFTLTDVPSNVPPGAEIPVVIQLGRWRRQFSFNVPACQTTQVGNLVMPHNHTEGDIPLTAISTGSVDAIECVLLKMGVDQAEFTNSLGTGRIQLYSGGGGSGASPPSGGLAEPALMENGGSFLKYDQILLPCWGGPFTKTNTELANLVTYANSGGHFFATHFSYTWLYENNPFNTTAQWNVGHSADNGPDPFTVELPPTNPSGTVFSNWLHLVGSMPNPQTVEISYPRHDVNKVLLQSTDWIDGKDPIDQSQMLLHYTFNTPVSATTQCGHVIYSDFHVANSATGPATFFPAECDSNPLTTQEKILEYMIWDLSSCVPGPPTPPTCTPITCADQNITCGPAGDGCGNEITSCGTCALPQTCGGGGVPGQCGAPDGGVCTPKTCAEQNIACGPAGDGCGNEIPNCGNCTPPEGCGGGGVPGQCGLPPEGGTCTPRTCAQQNIFCGPAGDGCGNEIPSCGVCVAPQTCGGGGVAGQCGTLDGGICSPKSCAAQGIQCGTTGDGCGNTLQCPNCPSGQTCNTTDGQCVPTSE